MSTHGTVVINLDFFLHPSQSCLGVRSISLILLLGTLGSIMNQLPTMEALPLGDVLLLPLPLLSRKCQSRILLHLFLDLTTFAATSYLGQPSDLFLAKRFPHLFPSWKISSAQNALDKCLPILKDCIQGDYHHELLIRCGPYGSKLVPNLLQPTEVEIYLLPLLHLIRLWLIL